MTMLKPFLSVISSFGAAFIATAQFCVVALLSLMISGTETSAQGLEILGPTEPVVEGEDVIFTVTIDDSLLADSLIFLTRDIMSSELATATRNVDYSSIFIDQTVEINNLTLQFRVPTIRDDLVEMDEVFQGVAAILRDMNVIASAEAVATITDRAAGSTVSISGGGAVTEGDEATFTVTLSGSPGADLVVDYATAAGTAGASDFTATNDTLTFAADTLTLTQTFTVPTTADAQVEGDETFTATLSANPTTPLPTGFTLGTTTATATITAGGAATVSISGGGAVTEGDEAMFTVTLSGSPGADLVVDYATAAGTAGASDFTATNDTLTFPADTTTLTQTFTVPTTADDQVEGDETFTATLSASPSSPLPTGFTLGTTTATATITAGGSATVSISGGGAVTEGDEATFTVTLSGSPGADLVVDYATAAGTAGASDFMATNDTLTFAADTLTLTQTFTVPTTADDQVEGDETFTATLSANGSSPLPTGFTLGTTTATATITAGGSATVSISGGGAVTEGDEATFTVTLSGSPGADLVVDYATAAGTAGASDFTATNDTLTFPADTTTLTQTFTVPTTADDQVEGDETFTATLSTSPSSPLPTGFTLGTTTATATITAAGSATVSISGGGAVTEGDEATFTVTLSGSPGADLVVDYATAAGTAGASDFMATNDTLTFPADTTTLTQTFTVPTTADDQVEGDETFTATLSASPSSPLPTGFTLGTTTATATITAGGSATVSISGGGAVTEGDEATFTVTLSGSPGADLVVDYATAAGTAGASDFTATNDTLTFPADTTTLTQTFTVPTTADDQVEGDETFTATLSANGSSPLPAGFTLGTTTATATITAAGSATVSISGGGAVTEGDEATFTVTLSASPGADLVVDYATTAGTAGANDFTATNDTLTFPADTTTLTQTFTVQTTDDAQVEGDETFTATLSANSSSPLPTGFTLGTATATATIAAAGSATVSISGGGAVTEGDEATFTVTLSASPGSEVVVNYATAAGTAGASDFTATNGTLTFDANTTTLSQTFTVPTTDDVLVEGDETFTATLSANPSSPLPTGFTLGTATATATIAAAGSATVSISGGGTVNEGDEATFTVTLSGSPGADLVVDYATAAGTAGASDFTATNDTLTFPADTTTLTQTFTVPTTADDQVEGDETFTATLSANPTTPLPTGFTLGTTTATATITAGGAATVSISGGGAVTEGDEAMFTVTLSGSPGADLVVDYATAAGTAGASDFTATNDTLTFPADTTTLTQTFTVQTTDDAQVEGDETFTATLSANSSSPLPTGFTIGTATATATIAAAGSATVSISGGGTVNEGDEATFTVTLSGSPGAELLVDYATAAGTAGASDFAEANGTLTFAANTTTLSQTFTVQTTDDAQVEGDETFTATLSANSSSPLPTGFTIGTATATATIAAAGSATVSISGGGAVTEGDEATFTVTLSGSPGADLVVDYATAAGTAGANDFTAESGMLTFAADTLTLTQTFTVPTTADAQVEGDETFTATLSANPTTPLPTGFTLGTTTATATITAGGAATVSISGGGAVTEGDEAMFTVTLSGSPGADLVVDYATAAGTAGASDFAEANGTLTFAANTTTLSQTFTVPTTDDAQVEGDETFTATLSANSSSPLPTGFTLGTATATATIAAAGSATVSISGGGAVTEGDEATFTVTLSGSPGADLVVDYATAAGTAGASDFTATNDTLTFPADTTTLTQTFTVPTTADDQVEGDETFTATLSANGSSPLPAGFTLGTTTATATITAGGAATVSISGGGAVTEGELATFTVMLSASPGADLVVDYATAAGTAGASDFTETMGTLTFAADTLTLTQAFTVPTTADDQVEGDETFTATLSANGSSPLPAGFTLGTTTATATITAAGSATVSISGGGAVTEGDEATFTVTLSGSPGAELLVDYATAAGTAGASDFTETMGTLTFAADTLTLTQAFTVPTTADAQVEGDETFTATLSANSSSPLPTGFTLGTATATATIAAAGSATVSISGGGTVNEGDEATFTVTLSGSPGADLVVDYATAAGTAGASDFTETMGTLTFAADTLTLTQTFTVPTTADDQVEGDETFTATLSANGSSPLPAGFTLGTTTATATITAGGSATVSISGGGAVTEGDEATFTVTLSGSPGADLVVDYATTAGTAGANDFTATNDTLTFAADTLTLTQTFTVQTTDDVQVEGDETFTATLSANSSSPLPTGFTLGTATATATIAAAGSATVLISGGGAVTEGDEATFTVTLSASPGAEVVVDYATAIGTAGANDFTARSGMLTFPADTLDLTQTFTVSVENDAQVEGDETFTATLSANDSSPLPAGFSFGTTTATVTIPAAGSATVSISGGGAVTEGDEATFTVTLSGSPGADLVVDYATAAGTAGASDFTATNDTLTFPADTTTLTQTFTVPTTADDQVEGDETFTATLSANGSSPLPAGFTIGTATATATIAAAGSATVSISGGGAVTEGDEATFTVTLSGSPGADLVVDYATAAGTAGASDFMATNDTLTFAADTLTLTQTFTVPTTADDQVEGDETFTATLSANGSSPLPAGFTLGTTTATATITAAGSATVSISGGGAVTEGDEATFTVTLSASPGADLVVDYATTAGTAGASDFAEANGTLTFAANTTTLSQTFTVPTTDDVLVEGDETFTATLSANPSSPLPTGFTLGTATATATIAAAGSATVSISGGGAVTEGDEATFTVTLSASPGSEVVVNYATAAGTAGASDFTATNGTLTFDANTTTLSQTFTVQTTDDAQVEGDETFTATLSANSSSPLPTGFTIGTATATATIAAAGSATVSISGGGAVTEGDEATFTVTLSGSPGADLVVDYATAAGTAGANDFTAESGMLTFAADTLTLTQTFTVPTTADAQVEGDETFTATLSANPTTPLPTGFTLGTTTATATITAGGAATVSISGGGAVTEGDEAMFTVTLSGSPGADLVVDYATAAGTAGASDFAEANGTLTFAANTTTLSQTFTVPTTDDAQVEGDETFTATLSANSSSPLPTGFTLGTATATATIAAAGSATVSISGGGAVTEGDEATFTVTLSGSPGADLVVDYATAAGTAGASDFTATNDTLTFPADTTTLTQTFTVPTTADDQVEGDETFTATLSANPTTPLPTGFTLGTTTATATITAGGAATVSISGGGAVTEGDEAMFTVTLSGSPGADLVVDYATAAGTAGASDFTATNDTLTFPADTTTLTQTFTVPTTADDQVEGDETFTATLSASPSSPLPTGFTLGTTTATATITAGGSATVSISGGGAVTEGDEATFTVTLSGSPGADLVVDYATAAGTAGASDFMATNDTLTFAADTLTLTQTFTVPTTADDQVEGDETFTATLSANGSSPLPTGFTLGTTTATATITAGGSATVSISGGGAVTEGDEATFTVTLSGSPGADLVVDYATAAGTAGASDFTATNDTLTFPADTTTLTQTFTVPTTADDQVEGDETFTATLSTSPSSPLPTGFTLGTTTATATITAAGSATVSISGGGAVTEGDEATFTVTLSGSPGADLVVDYATAAGTAGASDFMATNDTLTFPADTTTLTQTFTVPTTADDQVEGDETFTATLSASPSSPLPTGFTLGTTTATATITAGGSATVSISGGGAVTEGDEATFTVTLSASPGAEVVVDYATAIGTAGANDFTARSGMLTFPADTLDLTQTFTVPTTADDQVEGDETFTATLSANGSSPLPAGFTLGTTTATATITAAGSATVSISGGGAVTEGDEATFTVTLSASPGADLVVDYATTAGTAGANDFTATNDTLTFPADTTTLTQTFTVQTTDDAQVEGDETFTATLSANSSSPLPTGFTLGTATATATIAAAGSATVSISGGGAVTEGDEATFTVTLSASPGSEVVVNYATAAGTAGASDFTATNGTLTFDANTTTLSQTFTVPTTDDVLVEGDETFTATLSANGSSPLPAGFTIGTATATATIAAAGSATVSISGGGAVTEGDEATFTVTLSGSPGADLVVDYATAAGTAGASDFMATNDTLTFAADTLTLTQTFTVPTTADDQVEGDETFTATLSANGSSPLPAGFTLGTTTATATITAAGSATVSISGGGAVTEGDEATFTVTLSASPGADLVVDYATTAGTAGASDFAEANGTLTFAANTTTLSQTFTVPTTDDVLVEGDETFTATLSANPSSPLPTGFTLGTATATATIAAAGSATVSISGGGAVTEGDEATFTVTLSASPGSEVVVNYATAAGTAGASDFTATNGTLTFDANTTTLSQTFTVPTTDDVLVEGDETFTATLSANSSSPLPTGFTIGTATATATIAAAGSATVSISGGGTVNEGDEATFTVTLSGSPGSEVVVNYATAAGTAGASDFTATSGTLTFPAEDTTALSQTFTVPTTDDVLVEGDETFTATLSANSSSPLPTGFTLGTATATATIAAAGSATVSISGGGAVTEGDEATFTVTLSASPGSEVVVNYATAAGTAGASDFTATNGTLTFDANTTTLSQTFTVPTTDDVLVEGDETFTATLSANPSSPLPTGFTLGTATATATIAAAGSATVSISGGGTVNEGDEATFTVTLSGSPGSEVVVNYATATGTAGASDFTATNGTLTFDANTPTLTQTFTVSVENDGLAEEAETFTAGLSTNASSPLPAGFTLGTATATATIEATIATADAGPDQTASEGETVTLDGIGSSDPAVSDMVRYRWAQIPGTTVALTGADTVTATFIAPNRQTANDGELVFELTVTDPDGDISTDTVTIFVNTDVSVQKTVNTINRFLDMRTRLILANQPNISRRISRLQRGVGSEPLSFATGEITKLMPFEFDFLSLGSRTYNFATSLDQVTRVADQLQVSRGAMGHHERRRFDVWFEGGFHKFRGSAGSSGDFAIAHLGADYLLSPDLLVGGVLQYDRLTDSNEDSRAKGIGWMVGPYVTARLQENLYLDARVVGGKSNNEVTPVGTYTDSFTSTRYLADVSLSGEFTQGRWIIRPNAGLSWLIDRQSAYTNTLGNTIPGQTVSQGQLKFGPTISMQFLRSNGWLCEPTVTLDAIYSHANAIGGRGLIGTDIGLEDGWRARVAFGIRMTSPDGTHLSLTGNYDGIGSGYEAWGLEMYLDTEF